MSDEADPMGWPEALDDYQRVLDEAEASIADPDAVPAGFTIDPFVPPSDLGPLPPELAERAAALAQRTAVLVARVRHLAQTAAPELATSRRHDRRGSHPVASFDLRA